MLYEMHRASPQSSGRRRHSSIVSHYTMMYKEVISRHSTDMQTYPRDYESVRLSYFDSYKSGRDHVVEGLAQKNTM